MKKDNNLELVDPKSVHVNENVITSGVTVKHEEIISNLTEEDVKYINIRKQIELDTIQKYDKVSITPRKECWYIIDSKWLNQWTKYVLHKSTINDTNCSTDKNSKNDVDNELDDEVSPPGLLTTEDLHDENGELLLNLQPNLDYRGVRPLIYYIFVELYGRKEITKRNPELTRYQCDIYKIPVTTVDMLKIRYVWHTKAKAEVRELRALWTPPPPEDEEYSMKKPIFCGLTLKHIEIFIYWFFWNLYYCITCRCGFQWCHSTKKSKQGGARKRSGREKIKYSNYQPLDNKTYMSESEYEYGSQTTNQDEDNLEEMESGTLKLNNSRVGSSDVNSSIGNAEKSFKKSYFF